MYIYIYIGSLYLQSLLLSLSALNYNLCVRTPALCHPYTRCFLFVSPLSSPCPPQSPSLIARPLCILSLPCTAQDVGESWDQQLQLASDKIVEWLADDSNKNKKVIDVAWVMRQVAASQPPRLPDVPAHVRFCQRWGGGRNQHLLRDLMEYLHMAMPSGRIVSGSFLDKLASMKLTAGDLMERTVHACVMAQATNPKERENVGTSVTEIHVKQLQANKKAMGLQVNSIIEKTLSLAVDPATRKIVNEMSVELINFVFDIDDKFQTLDAVTAHFIQKLGQGEAAEQPTEKTKEALSSTVGIVEVERGGMTNAGRIVLEGKGFFVGCIVEPKKGSPSIVDEQYEMMFINDDGSAGIAAVQRDGSVAQKTTTIKLEDICNNYKQARSKIEPLTGYPENKADKSPEMIDSIRRSAVMFAMSKLVSESTGKNAPFMSNMTYSCQKKPVVRLFALTDAEKGELRIVPLTTKLGKMSANTPSSSIICTVNGEQFVMQRAVDEKSFIAEFWFLRVTHEQQESNMMLKTYTTKVVPIPGDTKSSFSVGIPCAISTKQIAAGTELVLFRPADAKPEKDNKMSMPVQLSDVLSEERPAKVRKH